MAPEFLVARRFSGSDGTGEEAATAAAVAVAEVLAIGGWSIGLMVAVTVVLDVDDLTTGAADVDAVVVFGTAFSMTAGELTVATDAVDAVDVATDGELRLDA